MTFSFGALTFLTSVFRTVSNDIVQKLIYQSDDEPLPKYPDLKLTAVNVLRAMICLQTVATYIIIALLMTNIGIKQREGRQ